MRLQDTTCKARVRYDLQVWRPYGRHIHEFSYRRVKQGKRCQTKLDVPIPIRVVDGRTLSVYKPHKILFIAYPRNSSSNSGNELLSCPTFEKSLHSAIPSPLQSRTHHQNGVPTFGACAELVPLETGVALPGIVSTSTACGRNARFLHSRSDVVTLA